MRITPVIAGGLVLIIAATASAQKKQQPGTTNFYGARNLQFMTARYVAVMPPYTGSGGEVMFGFDTMSNKTKTTDYKYFYGVELGGGGDWWGKADMGSFGERDASAGYVIFMIENKLFTTGKGPVRPYLGSSVSYGNGQLWSPDLKHHDSPTGGFQFYGAGLEAGAMFVGKNDYALTLAANGDARVLSVGADYKVIYPIMVTVGLCRWRGPMP